MAGAKKTKKTEIQLTEKGLWSYSAGRKPKIIAVQERGPGDFALRARWTRDDGARPKVTLDFTVRDDKGLVVPDKVKLAKERIDTMAARLLLGQDPLGRDEERAAAQATAEQTTPSDEDLKRRRTIAECYDAALHPKTGMYANVASRHAEQVAKRADRLLGRNGLTPILNPGTRAADIRPSTIKSIWREIADRHKASDGKEYGLRVAENFVQDLFAILNWCCSEELIPDKSVPRMTKWHQELRNEWQQRTGEEPAEKPARPRYTEDEYHRLMAGLGDPRVDPRLKWVLEIGAELRAGQVKDTMRSAVQLPGDTHIAEPLPEGSLGRIRTPGRGKKLGEKLLLDEAQRAATEEALATYLANYERAWKAGEIRDYPMCPSHKMTRRPDGTVWERRVRPNVKPISRDGLRVAYRALEDIAGVEHVPGRGWYAPRRTAADITRELTKDDRLVERMGGWTAGSEMPKGVYEDHETDALREKRRELLSTVRGRAAGSKDEAPVARDAADPALSAGPADPLEELLAGLSEEQRAALAARLMGGATAPQRPRNEKPSGAVGPEGSESINNINDLQRAGDGIRTRDVQLGKLAFYP